MQLQGMENEYLKLSTIEQQLILHEVEKQGKDKILAELYKEGEKQTPLVYDKKRDTCYCRDYCTAFTINKIFYKKDIEKDPLTKNIFDTIQPIEKEKGYGPEGDDDHEFMVLGERTYYWWLQDADNNLLPAIQVKFRPHYYSGDQKAIENFINSYNQS